VGAGHADQLDCRRIGVARFAADGEERAFLRRRAVAGAGQLEPSFHRGCPLDQRFDLGQLAGAGGADRATQPGAGVDLADQALDLLQAEAGLLGDADEAEPADHLVAVAPLPVFALGLGQQPDRLVVADRRSGDTGLACRFSNRHLRCFVHLHPGLDFKPT